MSKNRVKINVASRSYTIIGEDSEAHIQSVGKLVDDQVRALSESHPELSNADRAVLAAVSVADEFIKTRNKLNKAVESLSQSEKSLTARLEDLSHEVAELKVSLEAAERQNQELSAIQEDVSGDSGIEMELGSRPSNDTHDVVYDPYSGEAIGEVEAEEQSDETESDDIDEDMTEDDDDDDDEDIDDEPHEDDDETSKVFDESADDIADEDDTLDEDEETDDFEDDDDEVTDSEAAETSSDDDDLEDDENWEEAEVTEPGEAGPDIDIYEAQAEEELWQDSTEAKADGDIDREYLINSVEDAVSDADDSVDDDEVVTQTAFDLGDEPQPDEDDYPDTSLLDDDRYNGYNE